jgi:hypothetical protein
MLALSLLLSACRGDAHGAPSDTAREQAAPDRVIPYPPGRWRLADPVEIDRVVLWASQIVVRHGESRVDPAFAMADWHSATPGGQRTRAQAYVLARELREQASKNPGAFADLARRRSEDVATQPLGGSLGGVPATQLVLWPQVLDALAATPPGQVSQVVETPYGFHVFLRRVPPAEETVTGAHIVIAHGDAGWIRILGRGDPQPPRSRDEALALANQLYERAKERPEEFAQLVEQYSDHRDSARGGDMGTWSTREPTFYPREVELLAGLALGEIAPPLDSPVGFQIIMRVPNRAREHYAMEQLRLTFDPLRPAPDPSSKSAVLEQASALARELRENPTRFAELQKEHCCEYSEDWIEGRGTPALTAALSGLEVGQLATQPVQSESSYVIPRRVEVPAGDHPPTLFELPEPRTPNIVALVKSRDDAFLKGELQSLGDEVLAGLALPDPLAARVTALHRDEARFVGLTTPEARVGAFNALLSDMKGLLEPSSYPRYLALVDGHFERLLLGR